MEYKIKASVINVIKKQAPETIKSNTTTLQRSKLLFELNTANAFKCFKYIFFFIFMKTLKSYYVFKAHCNWNVKEMIFKYFFQQTTDYFSYGGTNMTWL